MYNSFLCYQQYLQVTFDGTTGFLKEIKNLKSDVETKISQQLMFYIGMKGNNSEAKFTASGAYLFRPNGSHPIPLNKTATITVYKVTASDREIVFFVQLYSFIVYM